MSVVISMQRRVWQQRYFGLTIFLLSWQARWIFLPRVLGHGISEYVTLSLYATDVLMAGAIVWGFPRLRDSVRSSAPRRSLFLLLGYVLIVNAFVADPLAAGWKILTLLLIVGFTAIVVVAGDHERIVTVVIASGVVQTLIALWQIASQQVYGRTLLGMSPQTLATAGVSLVETGSGRWLRAYGTLPHPNILGGYLAVALLLTVDRYFHLYEKFQAWWNRAGAGNQGLWREPAVRATAWRIALTLGAFVCILAGLLASLSRSAALAVAVGSVVYLAQKYRQNRIRTIVLGAKLIVFSLALLIAWQAFLPDLWATRLTLQSRIETQSREERIAGYGDATHLAVRYGLLGTGLQNYTVALARQTPNQPRYRYQPIHNTFVLLALELGLAGIVAALWALWPFLKRLATYLLDEASPIGTATVALVVILGLFDHYLWSLHPGLLLIVIVALAISSRPNTA